MFRENVNCKDCCENYDRNGPGSDVGVMGKFSRWMAYKCLPTAQELFLEPSKKHDDAFHVGPSERYGFHREATFDGVNIDFLNECLELVKNPPNGLKGRWKVKLMPWVFRDIAKGYYLLIDKFGLERFPEKNCKERNK